MRRGLIMVLSLSCAPAQAALTCDQLGVIAQATVALRDQGASLHALLADAGRGEMRERYKPAQIEFIRRVIRMSFDASASPGEIVAACRDGAIAPPEGR
jgi:hypothetical protein